MGSWGSPKRPAFSAWSEKSRPWTEGLSAASLYQREGGHTCRSPETTLFAAVYIKNPNTDKHYGAEEKARYKHTIQKS